MKTFALRPLCCALAAAFLAAPLCSAEPEPASADNSKALSRWGQLTGTQPPQLVADANGETRLIWSATASVDLYSRESSGGELLTPYSSGNFYAIRASGDSRQVSDGSATWLQLDVTGSNDRALIPDAWQLNTLQAGRSGPGYQIAFGDVPVSYSTLGANTALRGLSAQRLFGPAALSASAGVIADSWTGLLDRNRRLQLLRNSAATKGEISLTPTTSVFSTLQGYSDVADSLPQGLGGALPAAGRSGTAGLSFSSGRFSLQTEAGTSEFREDGSAWLASGAGVVDATWQGEKVTLRSGYHDIGRNFASLSSAALPGVREAYLNGNWIASSWAILTADLRTSRNRNATMQPPASIPAEGTLPTQYLAPIPEKTNSATIQASLTVPQIRGLSALVQGSISRGSNADGGRNSLDNYGANLTYQRNGWTWGGGYQQARTFNAAFADSNATTHTWTASMGRTWTDPSGVLTLNGTLLGTRQRQDLDAGGRYKLDSATLSAGVEHARWGQLSASYTEGWGQDALSNRLRQSAGRLEAQRALGKRGAIKLYAMRSDNFAGVAALAYREQMVGIQLSYTLGGNPQ